MRTIPLFHLLIIAPVLTFTSYGSRVHESTNNLLDEGGIELASAKAQGCDGYFPMSEGTSSEMTIYDKKDKVSGMSTYKVIESKETDNGVIATVEMNFSDKKGNPGVEMSYEAKCQDGKYYLNLENSFSQLTSQYEAQGMAVTIEDGIAVIPNNLAVGDQLEDALMTMKMSSSVMNMEMTVTITDRKVTGKETITTPAGAFDCIILSQKSTMKMGKLMTVTTSSKEWLSKGVGHVRTESYDKNGKLEGYTLLTKFSK